MQKVLVDTYSYENIMNLSLVRNASFVLGNIPHHHDVVFPIGALFFTRFASSPPPR